MKRKLKILTAGILTGIIISLLFILAICVGSIIIYILQLIIFEFDFDDPTLFDLIVSLIVGGVIIIGIIIYLIKES